MNLGTLRKAALMTLDMKANPKSKFAKLSNVAKERLVNDVYSPEMSDDELISAIVDKIQQQKMPKNPKYELKNKNNDNISASYSDLERQADEILKANPEEEFVDAYYLPTQDDFEYSDEETLLNLLAENENIKRAQAFDNRYRKEAAIYDKQHYQPTKGPVWHIRKSSYKPQPEHQKMRALISDLLENQDDPYASGIDAISDTGSGVSPDKYRQYLDEWRKND